MEIIYFVSDSHRYDDAIYFGVGPRFGAAYNWRVEPLSNLTSCRCDVGIIDNRLEADDVRSIEMFLSRVPERQFPVFFRISDPDMPLSENPNVQFIFACGDRPGVHFATTYTPEGPFKAYVESLKRSRIVSLPYPYERQREVDVDMAQRCRRIFLSGANDARLYPLRNSLRERRGRSLLLRCVIHDLPHPGYPDLGERLKHGVVRERFVDYAARYSHFFLCPTVYDSELAKYLECAYAGCVPIGRAPKSLNGSVGDCFLEWRGTTRELISPLMGNVDDMRVVASKYRDLVRRLRDPETLVRAFEAEISAFV